MDQRVSPAATTWVAGSCPGEGAGAGAVCDVSCAGLEVSGRACVVSCARSVGTGPPSSPATRASRAARSERQIVVLLIKCLRERIERLSLALSFGRDLGSRLRPRELAGAFPGSPTTTLTTAPSRQEEHFPRNDLSRVARLLLSILPRPVLDAPLDVDPVAFLHVLLGQIRELGTLVVPANDPVPLGLLLLLPPLPRPLPAGRQ